MTEAQFNALIAMIEAIVEDYDRDDAQSVGKRLRAIVVAKKLLVEDGGNP